MNKYKTYDEIRIAHSKGLVSFDKVIEAHKNLGKPYFQGS